MKIPATMRPWLMLPLLLEIASAYPPGGDQYSPPNRIAPDGNYDDSLAAVTGRDTPRDLALDKQMIGGLARDESKMAATDVPTLEELLQLWGIDPSATTTPRPQRGDIEVVERDGAVRGDVPGGARRLLWARGEDRWYGENEGLLPSDGLMQSDEPRVDEEQQQQQQTVKQPGHHRVHHHRGGASEQEARRRHWEEQQRRRLEEEERRREQQEAPSQLKQREEPETTSRVPPDTYEERLARWYKMKEEHERRLRERQNARRQQQQRQPQRPQEQRQQEQRQPQQQPETTPEPPRARPSADEDLENERKLQDYIRRNTPIVVRREPHRGAPPEAARSRPPQEEPARSEEDAQLEEHCRRATDERRHRARYDSGRRRHNDDNDEQARRAEVERCVSEERRRKSLEEQTRRYEEERRRRPEEGRSRVAAEPERNDDDEYQRTVAPDEPGTRGPNRGVSRVHPRPSDGAPRWTGPPVDGGDARPEEDPRRRQDDGRSRNRGQPVDERRGGWPPGRRENQEPDNGAADRYAEFKRNEDSRAPPEQQRRQQNEEEARLQQTPVSATIIVRASEPGVNGSSGGVAPPLLSARLAAGSGIDFPGLSPNRKGLDAPGFPAPATKRPPAKSPEACVWALVVCCKNTREPARLPRCFEATNCPTFDTVTVCDPETVRSANNEIMRFYLQGLSYGPPKQMIFS